jgi:putative peptidoglycan lipid II flippase
MAAFILSQIAGLVRWIVILNTFGAGAEMDAFLAANRATDTLFQLVAAGALSSAFIPTFTGLLVTGDRQNAWRLASAIANLVLVVLIVLAAAAAVFAPQIVRYALAAGFAADPAQEALAVELMRLMMPAAVLFGLSGLVMGILNAHQVFLVPALTPSMYSLGMIFGALVLAPGMGIYGLGWGVVIGALLHLTLQIPSLLRRGGRYYPSFGLSLPAVREVGRLFGPRLFGVAVLQLNLWVNVYLASFLPEGSMTAIISAFALMLMPQAAIAQSVAIAALPTLSAQYALGKLDEVRASLSASMRSVLLLSIPASLGLVLLRRPLIMTLYTALDERAVDLLSWALLWYAVGLVGHSLVEVLARAFYALHDTKTPVKIGAAAMALNIVLSIAFITLFARIGWAPHGGLALANSLATSLEAVALAYYMRRRLAGLEGSRTAAALLKTVLAAGVMGLVLLLWIGFSADFPAWVILGVGLGAGLGVFAAAALLLRVPEADDLARQALRLIRRFR